MIEKTIPVERVEHVINVFGSFDQNLRMIESEYGVTVVIKGHGTVVAQKDGGVEVNPTGNPGMATGGSGDVLTGMICGLLAQEMEPFDAAVFGVYLHGLAGDEAAAVLGTHAMLAGDLIRQIGTVLRQT